MTKRQWDLLESGHLAGERPADFMARLEAVVVALERLRADFNRLVEARRG